MKRLLCFLAVALAIACGTDPDRSLEGTYYLQRIAGKTVPQPISPVVWIRKGHLRLDPDGYFVDVSAWGTQTSTVGIDTFRGEWLAHGDTVILWYYPGYRVASRSDGQAMTLRWAGLEFEYLK